MEWTEPISLGVAVDEVNQAAFDGQQLPVAVRRRMARWIGGRQGLAGSYCGMPAPTSADFQGGLRVFTGESVRSGGGMAHVLGEEACRALILLDVRGRHVQSALDRASAGMTERLEAARLRERRAGRKWQGIYCCARCTCALWRHLAVGGLQACGPDEWLAAGLRNLRAHRTDNGRWRRYPFYYTLLALGELDTAEARAERRHAARACERALLAPQRRSDPFARRRQALVERILGAAG